MRSDSAADSHGEKRLPACTNCRRHKVKCVHSDPDDLTSPCLRCLKGNKDCVFDLGGRRRNKTQTPPTASSLHRVDSDASVHKDQYKYKHSTNNSFSNGIPQHGRQVYSNYQSVGAPLDFSIGSYDNSEDITGHSFANMSDSSIDSPMFKSKLNQNNNSTYSSPSEEASPEGQRGMNSFKKGTVPTSVSGLPRLEATNATGNVDGLQQTLSSQAASALPSIPPHQQLLPHQSLFVDAIPMDQFRTYKMSNPVNVMAIRDQMLAAWQKLTDRDTKRVNSYDSMDPEIFKGPPNRTIMDIGIISLAEAQQRLDCYRNFIYPFVPIISIGDASVNELVSERPLIFNTIMDITSRYIKDSASVATSMKIHNVAFVGLIKEVLIYSNKTLEGFLALLLQIYFYNEPEFYHRSRIYSLTAAATSLAFDLGLGVAPLAQAPGNHELPRYEQIVTPHILVDSTNEVCYKAWVASYSATFNALTGLRRPNADLWNNYTRDAISFLLRSNDPQSITIAKHAEYVHLHYEITERLFRKNNDSDVDTQSSPAILYLISQFDQEIERLKRLKMRPAQPTDMFMYLSTRAFLHQGVLYCNYSKQFGRTPFTNFSLAVFTPELSPEAARSFKICYEAAVGAVRALMELPRDKFLFLPTPLLFQLVFNAGLILKCRALVMVNKVYMDALGAPTDFIDDVSETAAALDTVCDAYPFSNMSLCLSFVIKLLMCHNDAVIHHMVTKYAYSPEIVVPLKEGSPTEESGTLPDISTNFVPDEELPPVPPGAIKAGESAHQFLIAPDEDIVAQNRRASAISLEGESLLRNTQIFPADLEFDGDHPFWQAGEEFWKGVFPSDGGLGIDL
ncbi:Transcriptional regulator WAR1 [Wickerhamiella sorbophila]|uniref:Transcriptional regulator WAR1 n=1 Tax=Wickerhamiella sorbophila TaxID=45607 RepID=A0A2T0FJZ1_9ASCO|nr:Transcriptional regulator WAR1 [Wickerhamiella sorbophila]PRT55314.1 Transcriptional regulator WAR1 [Wickerhamiella sorbophila]